MTNASIIGDNHGAARIDTFLEMSTIFMNLFSLFLLIHKIDNFISMTYDFFPGLSQNLSQLFDNADDYYVIINVGEGLDTTDFHAHSIILKARSLYFKRALSENWITNKNGIITFKKPNISPTIFEIIIRYMYTGILDLNDQTGNEILDLLVASDELLLEELIIFVQSHLFEKQNEWLQQNIIKVLHTVSHIESCTQLKNNCLEYICDNPESFLNLPEFPTLKKNVVEDILSFHMANAQPNRNIMPPRHRNIAVDSIIINPKYAVILTNWIQRKDDNTKILMGNKYNFNLIYRGSRESYDDRIIRSKFKGPGACVLMVKIKENDVVIGGYIPPDMKRYENFHSSSYDWCETRESFIFSLGNGKDLKNFMISRVTNNSRAIYGDGSLNFGKY
ncbi:15300_t:CDS:2 [Funneliformis geosporum]|uniref:15300_t:CDS:1 n=1 Tax=Funneliformis geosporum TaxID=1117311 RepID=A0A9W4SKQ5_9GLOM|nr:15300_t:CDS:2 [Funneliformis geosporum]